ncbi:MAG: hypothetical protein IKP44_04525, partial [Bacteroidaceae bacterium]|nr:hypothetical protein [Bacteroidaceae bacterium]
MRKVDKKRDNTLKKAGQHVEMSGRTRCFRHFGEVFCNEKAGNCKWRRRSERGTIARIHLGIKRLEAYEGTEMLHCCKLHEDFRHMIFTIGLLKVILYNI